MNPGERSERGASHREFPRYVPQKIAVGVWRPENAGTHLVANHVHLAPGNTVAGADAAKRADFVQLSVQLRQKPAGRRRNACLSYHHVRKRDACRQQIDITYESARPCVVHVKDTGARLLNHLGALGLNDGDRSACHDLAGVTSGDDFQHQGDRTSGRRRGEECLSVIPGAGKSSPALADEPS